MEVRLCLTCAHAGAPLHPVEMAHPFARIAPSADTSPASGARTSACIHCTGALGVFSPARARCATFYAWLCRCALRGSSLCHVRRNLRFATHPVASECGPQGGDPLPALPALSHSPVGGNPPLRSDSAASTPNGFVIAVRGTHRWEYPPLPCHEWPKERSIATHD